MRKLGLIIIAVIFALGAMGIGYAWWTDTLTINGVVTTGHLTWIFIQPISQSDVGTDKNARDLHTDVPWVTSPSVNVGNCTCLITTDHLVTYTINNGYPGYYDKLTVTTKNVSTMPIKIKNVSISYGGVDYLLSDGNIVTTPDNAMQLRWTGDTGAAINQDATAAENFEFLVLQSSEPQHSNQFDITLIAKQSIEP